MRTGLPLLVLAALLTFVGEPTQAASPVDRAILRAQTEATLNAIQNQVRQSVRPHLSVSKLEGAIEPASSRQEGRVDRSQERVTGTE